MLVKMSICYRISKSIWQDLQGRGLSIYGMTATLVEEPNGNKKFISS